MSAPEYRDPHSTFVHLFWGLRFGAQRRASHTHFPPDVYLEGSAMRQTVCCRRNHQGPRAVLNALERLAGGYGADCERVRQDLAIAQSQLRDYQARLGKSFLHDAYLSELTGLRDQLKAGLSATAELQADGDRPTDVPARRTDQAHSRAPIPSTPRRSANVRSIPPPRNPSPPALGGVQRRFPPPSRWYHPPPPNRCQRRPSRRNPPLRPSSRR